MYVLYDVCTNWLFRTTILIYYTPYNIMYNLGMQVLQEIYHLVAQRYIIMTYVVHTYVYLYRWNEVTSPFLPPTPRHLIAIISYSNILYVRRYNIYFFFTFHLLLFYSMLFLFFIIQFFSHHYQYFDRTLLLVLFIYLFIY